MDFTVFLTGKSLFPSVYSYNCVGTPVVAEIGYLVVHHCASKVVGYGNLAFLATGTEQATGYFHRLKINMARKL